MLKARTSGPIGVRVSVIFRERIEAALEKTKTVFVWSSFPRHRSPPLATSVAKTQPRDFYWAVVHAPVHSFTPAVRGRTCRPRHRSARPRRKPMSASRPGAFIGELSILDGLPRSAAIVAIRDCELSFVTRDTFKKFAKQKGEIYEHLTCLLAHRLRETDDLLAATSFSTVKARLARALLELTKHLGKEKGAGIEIDHRISQTDLAALAGIARENVARTLAEWKLKKNRDPCRTSLLPQ